MESSNKHCVIHNHRFIRTYRASRMALHLLYAVAIAALLLPWLPHKTRIRLERRWNSGLMGILNIKIRLGGIAPDLSEQNMIIIIAQP